MPEVRPRSDSRSTHEKVVDFIMEGEKKEWTLLLNLTCHLPVVRHRNDAVKLFST